MKQRSDIQSHGLGLRRHQGFFSFMLSRSPRGRLGFCHENTQAAQGGDYMGRREERHRQTETQTDRHRKRERVLGGIWVSPIGTPPPTSIGP